MANLNKIVLIGQLTADPESRLTVDGLPVAKFRLAVERPAAEGTTGTDFIDVVAWRKLAEVSGQNFKKGNLALVEGRIQNRSYENQAGQRIWATEVVASNVALLSQAAVSLEKKEKASPVLSAAAEEDELVEDSDLASDLPF